MTRSIENEKRRIVEEYMYDGMSPLQILNSSIADKDGKTAYVFDDIEVIESIMQEIIGEWSKKQIESRNASLYRTINILDRQLSWLNIMRRSKGDDEKTISITKAIAEIALARHNLIDSAKTNEASDSAGDESAQA